MYDSLELPSRKWQARWIWTDTGSQTKNVFCCFRKILSLPELSENCRLFIAADTRYQLFVNGHFFRGGPPQSQPFFQYYDEYDISPNLHDGDNCIAVLVNHVGNIADARPGLLLEIIDGEGKSLLSTDSTWRARREDAWYADTYFSRMNQMAPYQEFLDGRKMLLGWQGAGFDDSTWDFADIIGGRTSDRPPASGPWARLAPRDIPYMREEPVSAAEVYRIEESLDLNNRSRMNDLAPSLSMVGTPLKYCVVESPDNLLSKDGSTVVQGSTNHLDLDFDGIYAPAIVLDFGKVVTARARLELDAAAGSTVEIGYAERLIDGNFNIAMECEFADRYIMRDGAQVFESFAWRAFRYLKLRFRNCHEPVTVKSVLGITTGYPYEEKGSFASSDEMLSSVFDICRETVRLCSHDCLMDTPWREQAQWLGDVALVTVPAIYACFGDTQLPGKFFRQAAHNQHATGMISNVSNTVNHRWQGAIPDYSLWWIDGLWKHYMYTGDKRWIHQYYPEALRIYHAHLPYINDNGLLEDMPYWVFIDWADTDRRGECTAYNAIFYIALQRIQAMARLKGDRYVEEQAGAVIARMKDAFKERLFDPQRHCFADANIDGVLSEKVSEHANVVAIFAGLCDEATSKEIVSALFDSEELSATEVQPFFAIIALKAFCRVGRFDLALGMLRERWGRRMVGSGATSAYEEWYQNGSWRNGDFTGFLRTHSHAWSAGPAEFLIVDLMGLEILEPGCGYIRLTPVETDFDYTAVYPTPRGSVRVEHREGLIDIATHGDIIVE